MVDTNDSNKTLALNTFGVPANTTAICKSTSLNITSDHHLVELVVYMSKTRVEGVEIFYETESGLDQFLMMGKYTVNNPTTFYVYPSFVGFEGTQALNGDISTLQVISSYCAKDKIITSLVSPQEVKINNFESSQNTTIFKNETLISGNKTLP